MHIPMNTDDFLSRFYAFSEVPAPEGYEASSSITDVVSQLKSSAQLLSEWADLQKTKWAAKKRREEIILKERTKVDHAGVLGLHRMVKELSQWGGGLGLRVEHIPVVREKIRDPNSVLGMCLASDLFTLEIYLTATGSPGDIRLLTHGLQSFHESSRDGTLSPESLFAIIKEARFQDLADHLQGMGELYNVPTVDPKLRPKLYMALQALEADLVNLNKVILLSHHQGSVIQSDSIQMMQTASVGYVQSSYAGYPTELAVYASPMELLDPKSGNNVTLPHDVPPPHSLGGVRLAITLEPSTNRRIQTQSMVNPKPPLNFSKNFTQLNSFVMPCFFTLNILQPTLWRSASSPRKGGSMGSRSIGRSAIPPFPICVSLVQEISKKSTIHFVDLEQAQPLEILLGESIKLTPEACGMFFCNVAGSEQAYKLTNPGTLLAVQVVKIPFLSSIQLPDIISYLRKQAALSSLLRSCMHKTAVTSARFLEVQLHSVEKVHVRFAHPLTNHMCTVVINLADYMNPSCFLSSESSSSALCSNDYASTILRRCGSIPYLMRSIINKCSSEAPLSPVKLPPSLLPLTPSLDTASFHRQLDAELSSPITSSATSGLIPLPNAAPLQPSNQHRPDVGPTNVTSHPQLTLSAPQTLPESAPDMSSRSSLHGLHPQLPQPTASNKFILEYLKQPTYSSSKMSKLSSIAAAVNSVAMGASTGNTYGSSPSLDTASGSSTHSAESNLMLASMLYPNSSEDAFSNFSDNDKKKKRLRAQSVAGDLPLPSKNKKIRFQDDTLDQWRQQQQQHFGSLSFGRDFPQVATSHAMADFEQTTFQDHSSVSFDPVAIANNIISPTKSSSGHEIPSSSQSPSQLFSNTPDLNDPAILEELSKKISGRDLSKQQMEQVLQQIMITLAQSDGKKKSGVPLQGKKRAIPESAYSNQPNIKVIKKLKKDMQMSESIKKKRGRPPKLMSTLMMGPPHSSSGETELRSMTPPIFTGGDLSDSSNSSNNGSFSAGEQHSKSTSAISQQSHLRLFSSKMQNVNTGMSKLNEDQAENEDKFEFSGDDEPDDCDPRGDVDYRPHKSKKFNKKVKKTTNIFQTFCNPAQLTSQVKSPTVLVLKLNKSAADSEKRDSPGLNKDSSPNASSPASQLQDSHGSSSSSAQLLEEDKQVSNGRQVEKDLETCQSEIFEQPASSQLSKDAVSASSNIAKDVVSVSKPVCVPPPGVFELSSGPHREVDDFLSKSYQLKSESEAAVSDDVSQSSVSGKHSATSPKMKKITDVVSKLAKDRQPDEIFDAYSEQESKSLYCDNVDEDSSSKHASSVNPKGSSLGKSASKLSVNSQAAARTNVAMLKQSRLKHLSFTKSKPIDKSSKSVKKPSTPTQSSPTAPNPLTFLNKSSGNFQNFVIPKKVKSNQESVTATEADKTKPQAAFLPESASQPVPYRRASSNGDSPTSSSQFPPAAVPQHAKGGHLPAPDAGSTIRCLTPPGPDLPTPVNAPRQLSQDARVSQHHPAHTMPRAFLDHAPRSHPPRYMSPHMQPQRPPFLPRGTGYRPDQIPRMPVQPRMFRPRLMCNPVTRASCAPPSSFDNGGRLPFPSTQPRAPHPAPMGNPARYPTPPPPTSTADNESNDDEIHVKEIVLDDTPASPPAHEKGD